MQESSLHQLIKVEEITKLLSDLAGELTEEHNKTIFNSYLYSIFNNQDNLIMMLKNESIALANEHALKFFGTPSIKEMKEKFKLFDTLLLRHDSFLYSRADGISCLEKVKKDIDKLYNVKMTDTNHTPHHFILRLTSIADTVTSLLIAAKEAGAVIKVYNFYKGLVVSNNAVITYANPDLTVFKTSFLQQKAIQYEKKVILHSELFPYEIQSNDVRELNFHNQSVELGKCAMLKTTPVERKYLILEPHEKHKVNLFSV